MKSKQARRPTGATADTARTAPRTPAPPPLPAVPPPVLDLAQRQARAEWLGHRLDGMPVAARRGGDAPDLPGAPLQPQGAQLHPPGTPAMPRAALGPPQGAQAPIQRVLTPTPSREEENPHTPLLRPPGGRRQVMVDTGPQIEDVHHQAIATATSEDTKTAISGISGLGTAGSIGSRAADYLDTRYDQPNVVPGLGVTTGALGALGSTVDAVTRLRRMKNDTQKTGDKAVLGLEATSSLGNATVSGASAATHASSLFSTSAAMATNVAAPAAMVMGGADVIGGSVSAYRAAGRQKKLDAIQDSAVVDDHSKGVARFAAGSQQTRKWRGIGTALKGGLAIAGGAALLLGAGPVGWGLLGGAAAVAGGMALYKQYRKHKEGKKIRNDPNYQAQLAAGDQVRIPTAEDLGRQSRLKRWNPLNTKSSRTHDLVRAQIARNLEHHVGNPDRDHDDVQADDAENNPLGSIVGLLGLRNKGDRTKRARGRDIARALEG